jgi:hypothetical protein
MLLPEPEPEDVPELEPLGPELEPVDEPEEEPAPELALLPPLPLEE